MSVSASSDLLQRHGDVLFSSMDKINAELLCLTYGALVCQLVKDYQSDVATINTELDKLGHAIGCRLIDELLCKAPTLACANFRETANVIAKLGLRVFLGISGEVGKWRADGRQCSISFKGSPLLDFVELPESLMDLNYQAVISGCIRGACQMTQINVSVDWVRDELKGAGESEIKITLNQVRHHFYIVLLNLVDLVFVYDDVRMFSVYLFSCSHIVLFLIYRCCKKSLLMKSEWCLIDGYCYHLIS